LPIWKRNLFVLCVAQLLTLIGFSAYLSFIPFYVQELGASSFAEATSWLAAFQTGGGIAMMLAAPLWGSLADRYGRKVMLVRATAAGCILAFLMGSVHNPMQLTVIRILQGVFCGTVSAAITIVATQTPEEHFGFGMGLIQTVQFLAQALGPVFGGFAADALGYRAVFPISSALMVIALLLIATLVKERFVAPEPQTQVQHSKPKLRMLEMLTRSNGALLLSLGAISFALAVLSPIMSLYVKSLDPGEPHLATLAGAVVSVTAITSALAAIAAGRLGDKLGQKAILLACTVGVALTHVPQAFVSNATQLILLRTVLGVFTGGMMPTANALLARSTPSSKRGTIFGLATSVQSGGGALGPVVGAAVGNAWGMPSVFLVTAATFGIVATLVAAMVHPRSVAEVETISAQMAAVDEAGLPAQPTQTPTSNCP
jgi:MFS transporter, DHA1 family, multidrug resistance protein